MENYKILGGLIAVGGVFSTGMVIYGLRQAYRDLREIYLQEATEIKQKIAKRREAKARSLERLTTKLDAANKQAQGEN